MKNTVIKNACWTVLLSMMVLGAYSAAMAGTVPPGRFLPIQRDAMPAGGKKFLAKNAGSVSLDEVNGNRFFSLEGVRPPAAIKRIKQKAAAALTATTDAPVASAPKSKKLFDGAVMLTPASPPAIEEQEKAQIPEVPEKQTAAKKLPAKKAKIPTREKPVANLSFPPKPEAPKQPLSEQQAADIRSLFE